MAPEVIQNMPYTIAADVFSFGIVLYEIISRKVPYANTNPLTIMMRVVKKGERPNMSAIPSTCDERLKNLAVRCWDQNANYRPSFNEIISVLDSIVIQ